MTNLSSLFELTTALHEAWCAQTSTWADEWPADNPARGQCVPSALVVQDYFGGDLLRFSVTGQGIAEKHYCNVLPDGTLLDTTRSQYDVPVTLAVSPVSLGPYKNIRDKRLADDETRTRYELLKKRVVEILGQ